MAISNVYYRIKAVSLAFLTLCWVNSPATAQETCTNSWDRLIVEIQIAARFENVALNSLELFDQIQPRISTTSERSWPRYAQTPSLDNGWFVATYCISLGEITSDLEVPETLAFWLGPRRILLQLPELPPLVQPILERGSDRSNETANVVRLPNIIEIDPQRDPDWVSLELSELVTLANGQTALNLRLFNLGTLRVPSMPMSLYATNSWSRCESLPSVRRGTIRLKNVQGNWVGTSTDIAFGDEQNRSVEITVGPCGELDVEMSLGAVPPMNGGEELLVSFVFEDVITGPGAGSAFWDVFKAGGTISASGSTIWPQTVSLNLPSGQN